MSLWIRSQDTRVLINAVTLFIEPDDFEYRPFFKICGNSLLLGRYVSAVRCKEILDEIEELIKKTPSVENIVYRMPEE